MNEDLSAGVSFFWFVVKMQGHPKEIGEPDFWRISFEDCIKQMWLMDDSHPLYHLRWTLPTPGRSRQDIHRTINACSAPGLFPRWGGYLTVLKKIMKSKYSRKSSLRRTGRSIPSLSRKKKSIFFPPAFSFILSGVSLPLCWQVYRIVVIPSLLQA